MSSGNRRSFALGFLVGVAVTLMLAVAAGTFVTERHAREVELERKRAEPLAKELSNRPHTRLKSLREMRDQEQLRDAEELRRQMRRELDEAVPRPPRPAVPPLPPIGK
jgi:hypothetical protein